MSARSRGPALLVRVTPRGGRDAIDGWARDAKGRAYLRVRVAAPPAEGAANDALVAVVANALRRPKRAVRIVAGGHARLKTLELDDVQEADLRRAFGEPPPSGARR